MVVWEPLDTLMILPGSGCRLLVSQTHSLFSVPARGGDLRIAGVGFAQCWGGIYVVFGWSGQNTAWNYREKAEGGDSSHKCKRSGVKV